MTDEELETLAKLEREATPGPWRSMADGNQYVGTVRGQKIECVGASRVDPLVRPWNPHALLAFGFKPEEYAKARFLDADAAFIAAMRNATPGLIAEVRESRAEQYMLIHATAEEEKTIDDLSAKLLASDAEIQRLRKLAEYAGHNDPCHQTSKPSPGCSCGYEEGMKP